jgi:hypothetical protein
MGRVNSFGGRFCDGEQARIGISQECQAAPNLRATSQNTTVPLSLAAGSQFVGLPFPYLDCYVVPKYIFAEDGSANTGWVAVLDVLCCLLTSS